MATLSSTIGCNEVLGAWNGARGGHTVEHDPPDEHQSSSTITTTMKIKVMVPRDIYKLRYKVTCSRSKLTDHGTKDSHHNSRKGHTTIVDSTSSCIVYVHNHHKTTIQIAHQQFSVRLASIHTTIRGTRTELTISLQISDTLA